MRIKGFDIELTVKCNLACEYCYLGEKYGLERQDMSREIINDCVKLLKEYGIPIRNSCECQKIIKDHHGRFKKGRINNKKYNSFAGENITKIAKYKPLIVVPPTKIKRKGMKKTY